MAAPGAAVATGAIGQRRQTARAPPSGDERDLVDPAPWSVLAGSAGARRALADGGGPLPSLAPCRRMSAVSWTGHSIPSAARWSGPASTVPGQEGAAARGTRPRAWRSATKIHPRRDSHGRPLVFHPTGGRGRRSRGSAAFVGWLAGPPLRPPACPQPPGAGTASAASSRSPATSGRPETSGRPATSGRIAGPTREPAGRIAGPTREPAGRAIGSSAWPPRAMPAHRHPP